MLEVILENMAAKTNPDFHITKFSSKKITFPFRSFLQNKIILKSSGFPKDPKEYSPDLHV